VLRRLICIHSPHYKDARQAVDEQIGLQIPFLHDVWKEKLEARARIELANKGFAERYP
jgi:hypothetical protein